MNNDNSADILLFREGKHWLPEGFDLVWAIEMWATGGASLAKAERVVVALVVSGVGYGVVRATPEKGGQWRWVWNGAGQIGEADKRICAKSLEMGLWQLGATFKALEGNGLKWVQSQLGEEACATDIRVAGGWLGKGLSGVLDHIENEAAEMSRQARLKVALASVGDLGELL